MKNLRVAPEPPQSITPLGLLSEPELQTASSPGPALTAAPRDAQALRLAMASEHSLGLLSLVSPRASRAQARYLCV